jgi:hypothetical protein
MQIPTTLGWKSFAIVGGIAVLAVMGYNYAVTNFSALNKLPNA